MKIYLYRASNLKSTITFLAFFHSGSQFLSPTKNRRFLRFIRKQGMSFQLSVNKRCLSAPDATSLHHCYIPTSLPQEQAAKTDMLSVVKYCVQLRRVCLMLAYD